MMKTENKEDSEDRCRERSPLNSSVDRNDDDSNFSSGAKEHDRERTRRGDRPSRFGPRNSSSSHDRERDRGHSGKNNASERRVFVSNIAYEFGWQELKDLFRKEVGEVSYVSLFLDESDKPRGTGIVEFESANSVKKAVEKMHRYELKGRKLVVKEDFVENRDKYGRPHTRGSGGVNSGSGGRMRDESRGKWDPPPSHQTAFSQAAGIGIQKWGNTYGLSPQFLESLCINGPLMTRVFVANLDYKVDEKKLKDVFKLAGKVASAEISLDKEGKSRGFGVVEFDHPVEAVQAISMLHNQVLYERKLTVRMDRADRKSEGPPKLPEGLRGLGMGLGAGGTPLTDVTRNLPNNPQTIGGLAGEGPSVASSGLGANLGVAAALSNVVGHSSLGLAGMGGLGTNSLIGSGANEVGGLGSLTGGGGFGSSGLSAASAGLGGSGTGLGGGNSYSGALGSGNPGSYLGGNTGGGYGTSSTSALGPAFGGGGRDFDSLSAALGGAVGGGSYGTGVGERDYRGSSGVSNYSNGPTRGNMGAFVTGSSVRKSDTVVVKNLPPSSTWQMLRDKFRDVGEITFAEMRGKDVGLIRFKNEVAAERAVHMMDRRRIEGFTIEVNLF